MHLRGDVSIYVKFESSPIDCLYDGEVDLLSGEIYFHLYICYIPPLLPFSKSNKGSTLCHEGARLTNSFHDYLDWVI